MHKSVTKNKAVFQDIEWINPSTHVTPSKIKMIISATWDIICISFIHSCLQTTGIFNQNGDLNRFRLAVWLIQYELCYWENEVP